MTVTQLTYDVITLTAPAAVTMTAAVHPYSIPEIQSIAAHVLPPVTRAIHVAAMPAIKVISIPSGGGGDTRGNDGLVWPTGVQRFGTAPS